MNFATLQLETALNEIKNCNARYAMLLLEVDKTEGTDKQRYWIDKCQELSNETADVWTVYYALENALKSIEENEQLRNHGITSQD